MYNENVIVFIYLITKNPNSQKKKNQGDIAMDNVICLLHVYPTIYTNFILIS